MLRFVHANNHFSDTLSVCPFIAQAIESTVKIQLWLYRKHPSML